MAVHQLAMAAVAATAAVADLRRRRLLMATIYETVQALGKIVTDAVTAGNSNNIPAKVRRTTLVRVSTGR